MKLQKKFYGMAVAMALFALTGCNTEEETIKAVGEHVDNNPGKSEMVKGLFLLNEGSMGKNNCSLDYFDYTSGYYLRNIYPERNPSIPLGLGDAGNNIAVYKNKVFALIKDFVEVMDAETAKHIGEIDIPNCRDIKFHNDKAYISTYSGGEFIGNNNLGQVIEVDINTLSVERRVDVGYQPEELVITDGKIYVANSVAQDYFNYDNRVSVISLESFELIKNIEVAINLHRMAIDGNGKIYVSSRGNYADIKSDIFVIDSKTDAVTGSLGIPASTMWLDGDLLYITSSEWNNDSYSYTIKYALYNVAENRKVSDNFITDGTETEIVMPYGVAVNPESKEIFITDATDYVTPGYLYCYTSDGKRKWKVMTGDIPGHIAFTSITLK